MSLRSYRPPIWRVQEEYCAEVARRFRARRRGPRPPGPKIPDNSEPWIANPKTIDDLWMIAQCVQQRVDEFTAWRQRSSNS
jgi:hypothetical protein